jgi:NADH-quinone oxidoreductase subunit H
MSLVWVMIAAIIRTLRDQGYAHWTALLVIASVIVAAVLLFYLRKPLSGKLTRQQAGREAPVGNALPEPRFPIPPLPGEALPPVTQEAANG